MTPRSRGLWHCAWPSLVKVLVIGKYPPLQGGVSAACYHAALEAASLGHDVQIVTNAQLAASTNRCGVLPENDTDSPTVRVHYIRPVRERTFIPWSQPHCSLLAGLGLRVAEKTKPDLIVGWYMEPYGLAAALVATLRNLEFSLIHAGSDIGRLAKNRDLAAAYSAAFQKCRHVLTSSVLAKNLVTTFGVRMEQVVTAGWRPVDSPSRSSKPRGAGAYLTRLLSKFNYKAFYDDCSSEFAHLLERFEPSPTLLGDDSPIVAIFGKIHSAKGHFHIVPALARALEATQAKFRFLFNLSGDEANICDLLNQVLRYPNLARVTIAIPILHPKLVPELLHHCDIVCCLDHEFPFSPHQPRVIREALAAEAAVICSRESFEKSIPFAAQTLKEGCEIVEDPSDSEQLSGALCRLLQDRDLLRRRQLNGRQVSWVIEKVLPREGPLVQLIRAFEAPSSR